MTRGIPIRALVGVAVAAGCSGPGASHAAPATEPACATVCEGVCAATCDGCGGRCLQTLATGQSGPWISVAVDATSVYWSTTHGEIVKVAVAGGSPLTLAAGLKEGMPIALGDNNLYWTDNDADTLNSVPIEGGAGVVLATGLILPTSLAVDAIGVYITDVGTYDPSNHALLKVPLGGGSPLTMASGVGIPGAVAVGAGGVYWRAVSEDHATMSLLKMPVDGGTPVTVWSAPTSVPIRNSLATLIFVLALDPTSVVWGADATDLYPTTLLSLSNDSSVPTEITAGQSGIRALAIDSTTTYWSSLSADGRLGTVMKAPRAGGFPVTIWSGDEAPSGMAVDASSVYWTDGVHGRIVKLSPK